MNTLSKQDAATPQLDSTRIIPLTKGKFAIVDAADFDWLNQWKWQALFNKKRNNWYARRGVRFGGKHREIVNAPKGLDVDHEDGDGLRNVRSNLRVATRQQNMFNTGLQRNNTSGHKGVNWSKARNKWVAKIKFNRKQIYLGIFVNKEDAVARYRDVAVQMAGEFARTSPFKRRQD